MGVVTIDGTAGYAEDADDEYCFPVGTTTVTYTFEDSTGNSNTESCDVIISDGAGPTVDCHNCQLNVATGSLNVCAGNAGGWAPASFTHAGFQASVGDDQHTTGNYPNLLPGQLINIAADTAQGYPALSGWLACDCTLDTSATVRPFDVNDGLIAVPAYAEPAGTGRYGNVNAGWLSDPIIYTVSDAAGISGECDLDV